MKNKKQLNQIEDINSKRNILYIILLVVFIAILLIVLETLITSNIEKQRKETTNYTLWLSQNCLCLEENLLSCPEGFKLVGKLCLDKENITNTLKGCSKYDCAGQIKSFDVDSQKWLNQN
jgi:hypothetical protein